MRNGKAKKISLALAAIGGATVAGAFALDLPPWAQRMAENWGPGFVILGGLAACVVHYVPPGIFGDFVRAQQDQAVALSGIKDSLGVISGQNGKLDELQGMIDDLGIQNRVVIKKLDVIESRLSDGSDYR